MQESFKSKSHKLARKVLKLNYFILISFIPFNVLFIFYRKIKNTTQKPIKTMSKMEGVSHKNSPKRSILSRIQERRLVRLQTDGISWYTLRFSSTLTVISFWPKMCWLRMNFCGKRGTPSIRMWRSLLIITYLIISR